VGVTGPAAFLADEEEALQNIDFKLLSAAAGAVTVLLLLIYRSPLLCVIPLMTTVLALIAARATIYGLALSADLTVTGVSAGILSVLVFGAGTDANWSTGANWGGTAPVNGDILVFSGTTQPNNTNNISNLSVNGLAFAKLVLKINLS